jgi:hypothetical protein
MLVDAKWMARALVASGLLLSGALVSLATAETQISPPLPRELVLHPQGPVDVGRLAPARAGAWQPRVMPRGVPDPEALRRAKETLKEEREGVSGPAGVQRAIPGVHAPRILASFIGLRYSEGIGVIPPDTQVAAGPDHVFEAVNVQGRIFTKAGTLVSTFDLNDFFGLPATVDLFDPKIRFDQASGRWFLLAVTAQGSFGTWRLAVSTTSDPTGTFVLYTAETPGSGPDFPGLGVSHDKVVVTANAFQCNISCGGGFQGTEFLVLNKAQLVAGTTASAVLFAPPQGLFSIQPAQALSSNTTLYLAAVPFASASLVRIWSVTGVPGETPVSAATVDRAIVPLMTPPNAAQPGTSRTIVTNDNALLDAVFRDGHVWLAATSACLPSGDMATRACVRFIQISASSLTVLQDFDFGVAGIDHYYPAIQTDSSQTLVAVFSRSSASEFASVYAARRLVTDPPNTLQPPILIKAGEAPYDPLLGGFTESRWGDYSAAAVDPSDQSTVWLAGEYARAEGGAEWGTWVAQGRFSESAEGPAIGLLLNQTSFVPGDRFEFTVMLSNGNGPIVVDALLGLAFPASAGPALGCPLGDALLLAADGLTRAVVTCASAALAGQPALSRGVPVPGALPLTPVLGPVNFEWPGTAPGGTYLLFIILTIPNAFADGIVNPGDVVAIAVAELTFAP